jgi:pimeloyl-ACP methyl ester carboxylesterase
MRLATHIVGDGSPVVLLHGLFGSARNLGGVARALAAQHRVISIDLRNHGDSPHDPAMDYPIMAADVLETLAAAGVGPVAVLGHSMGGKVAMRMALTAPEAVTRLVVADIAPVRYPSHFGGFSRAMLAVPPTASRVQADALLAPDIPEQAVRLFLLHNFRSGAGWRIGIAEITAALPRIETWDETPGRYDGPVLFIAGARSDYVLPEYRPAILALFPAAQFVTVQDAGHWLHSEQPAVFNAAVGAFLSD